MAILVFKVFTLVVKTVAKPLISWITHYNKLKLQESNSKFLFIKNKIVWVGQVVNYYNIKINRKLFRLSNNEPIKALSEDKAVEKGAEFISELLVYSIVITLPILEWYRGSQIAKQEQYLKDQEIRRIKSDLSALKEQNTTLKDKINELKQILNEMDSKI